VHRIGPYTFTEQDARKTVANLPILLELAGQGRDASVLDGLLPEFTGDLDADLAIAWDVWGKVGPALRAAGQLPTRTVGRVAQLNVSAGGLPKLPVPRAMDVILSVRNVSPWVADWEAGARTRRPPYSP